MRREREGAREGGSEGAQEGEKSWTCEIRAKMKEREEKQGRGRDRGKRVESECSPLISPGVRVAPWPRSPPSLPRFGVDYLECSLSRNLLHFHVTSKRSTKSETAVEEVSKLSLNLFFVSLIAAN